MKLTVEGMTCGHCVGAVSRAVEALSARALVDLDAGTVWVEGTQDVAAVRKAIEGEGYTVADVDCTEPVRT